MLLASRRNAFFNHALAKRRSFSTVLRLTPRVAAISATVSPPKNRSSTIFA